MTTLTAGTVERLKPFKPISGATPDLMEVFKAEETRPEDEWAPEEEVLAVPEVQDAISFAVQDFEEWKKSL